MFMFFTTSIYAQAPDSSLKDKTIKEQVEFFSVLYETDSQVVNKSIECESKGNHDAVGDGGRSKGIAQIQVPTWKDLEQKYNKEFAEDLDYTSRFDQIKLMTWSFANGYGNKWTSYVAIKNGGKYSFYSKQMKRHYTVICKI